jgi:hypothetical protein
LWRDLRLWPSLFTFGSPLLRVCFGWIWPKIHWPGQTEAGPFRKRYGIFSEIQLTKHLIEFIFTETNHVFCNHPNKILIWHAWPALAI